jgi:hypothetical protein
MGQFSVTIYGDTGSVLSDNQHARTFDALFEALGDICEMFNPDECWNFLKAAGYASD